MHAITTYNIQRATELCAPRTERYNLNKLCSTVQPTSKQSHSRVTEVKEEGDEKSVLPMRSRKMLAPKINQIEWILCVLSKLHIVIVNKRTLKHSHILLEHIINVNYSSILPPFVRTHKVCVLGLLRVYYMLSNNMISCSFATSTTITLAAAAATTAEKKQDSFEVL